MLRAKCIGRESNPGLAESFEMQDLEWQRPILPLNHQCYWLKLVQTQSYIFTAIACPGAFCRQDGTCGSGRTSMVECGLPIVRREY